MVRPSRFSLHRRYHWTVQILNIIPNTLGNSHTRPIRLCAKEIAADKPNGKQKSNKETAKQIACVRLTEPEPMSSKKANWKRGKKRRNTNSRTFGLSTQLTDFCLMNPNAVAILAAMIFRLREKCLGSFSKMCLRRPTHSIRAVLSVFGDICDLLESAKRIHYNWVQCVSGFSNGQNRKKVATWMSDSRFSEDLWTDNCRLPAIEWGRVQRICAYMRDKRRLHAPYSILCARTSRSNSFIKIKIKMKRETTTSFKNYQTKCEIMTHANLSAPSPMREIERKKKTCDKQIKNEHSSRNQRFCVSSSFAYAAMGPYTIAFLWVYFVNHSIQNILNVIVEPRRDANSLSAHQSTNLNESLAAGACTRMVSMEFDSNLKDV